jgi:hypothetical protein
VSKFNESQWANEKLPFMYMMGSKSSVKNPSLKTRMMGYTKIHYSDVIYIWKMIQNTFWSHLWVGNLLMCVGGPTNNLC